MRKSIYFALVAFLVVGTIGHAYGSPLTPSANMQDALNYIGLNGQFSVLQTIVPPGALLAMQASLFYNLDVRGEILSHFKNYSFNSDGSLNTDTRSLTATYNNQAIAMVSKVFVQDALKNDASVTTFSMFDDYDAIQQRNALKRIQYVGGENSVAKIHFSLTYITDLGSCRNESDYKEMESALREHIKPNKKLIFTSQIEISAQVEDKKSNNKIESIGGSGTMWYECDPVTYKQSMTLAYRLPYAVTYNNHAYNFTLTKQQAIDIHNPVATFTGLTGDLFMDGVKAGTITLNEHSIDVVDTTGRHYSTFAASPPPQPPCP